MRSILLGICLIIGVSSIAQENCATYEYRRNLVEHDISVRESLERVQSFTRERLTYKQPLSTPAGGIQTSIRVITIPVVVHVVYNTAAQNISDEQIRSQIDVLNRDFRRRNADTSNTPEAFRQFATDCQLEFKLATIDPNGNATTGVVRRKTSIQLFGLDDRIKQSAIGGDDPWDTDKYLNIWVGSLAGGLIGYSSPLGGPKNRDGIVIRYTSFGTSGTATAPLNLGRTATHEVGHWLGLQHIWGDDYCGNDDVEDTPPQQGATRGCPSGKISSCSNTGTMYMNFMDFTNDACTNMFTKGQRDRMLVAFQPGGARYKLLSSNGATGTPVTPVPPPPDPVQQSPASIRFYPNPATASVYISAENLDVSNRVLVIYNQSGQAVKQITLLGESRAIDVSGLKRGMYYVRVLGEKASFSFVKN